jgi:hypothetical protein
MFVYNVKAIYIIKTLNLNVNSAALLIKIASNAVKITYVHYLNIFLALIIVLAAISLLAFYVNPIMKL